MIYTNENWKPPVTYCEPNEVEVQRMNKEEAITLLEKLRTFHNGTYAKAIDMAIKALQAEPEERAMRLIDADALHESINKETYRHTYIEQIHSIIDNAPTIDAVLVETLEQIPEACKNCSNHPINGGSGICSCTLGNMKITC